MFALSLLFHSEKINSRSLRIHVNRGDCFQSFQIDNLNRARFGPYTFNRNEGVTVIGRNRHAMEHLPFGRELCELASGFEVKNRYRLSAFVDRKSTRLNSSHLVISYAVFCLTKKK